MQTTSVQTLSERLRAKAESERQEIEAVMTSEHERLVESLKLQSAAALSTIEADIRMQADRMELPLSLVERRLRWMVGGLVGTALIASGALLSGAWAWTQWRRAELTATELRLGRLREQTASAQATLNRIEARIGPVQFQEGPQGIFLILPTGTDQRFWRCGERPCLRMR